jgi:hypothetical protein
MMNAYNLTEDELSTIQRVIPAARIELARLTDAVVTLQTANERQFETICTLRMVLDVALHKLEDLGLRNLAADLRERADREGRSW